MEGALLLPLFFYYHLHLHTSTTDPDTNPIPLRRDTKPIANDKNSDLWYNFCIF